MKKLTLFRHAKSSWKYNVSDRLRPLKKRGVNDAKLVSKILKKEKFLVDRVVSSPAKRALETSDIFLRTLDLPLSSVVIEEELYDFYGDKVIHYLKLLDDNFNSILIFGHNHALTNITNSYGDCYINNLPTSGVVSIEFDVKYWKNINKGTTTKIICPKDFK